jgi:hypothetical protein
MNVWRVTAFTCAAGAAAVFGGAVAAQEPATPEPSVVVWGGVEHWSRDSLQRWLAARGVDYSVWAERHPFAAARLESAPELDPVEAVPEPPNSDAQASVVREDYAPVTASATQVWTLQALLLVVLAASGALMLAAAAALSASPAVLDRRRWRPVIHVFARHAPAAGAAGAVLLGAVAVAIVVMTLTR